jgi:excisionase family DNA binding protein
VPSRVVHSPVPENFAEFLPRHLAAKQLGIGVTFLDKLIRTGCLPAFKLGRRTVLVRRADLMRVATARPMPVGKRGER